MERKEIHCRSATEEHACQCLLNDPGLKNALNYGEPANGGTNKLDYGAVAKAGILVFADWVHKTYIQPTALNTLWTAVMGSSYTLTDLVADVFGGLATVVSTVKAGVSAAWDGIKAAGQFIADTVVQVVIDTLVTLVTTGLRALLLTADALLGPSFSYSESHGIFTVPIAGTSLRLGLTSLQGGIAITFGDLVIRIHDLFGNPDLTTETLGIPEINAPPIFDEPIMKMKFASVVMLTLGTLVAGGLTAMKRFDQANSVFFASWIASFLLDVVAGSDYVHTATKENKDQRLNFLKLLLVIELTQLISLLFLAILERKLTSNQIWLLSLLWTTITTPLELIDSYWSDGTTIGGFFAAWQFTGILIAKGSGIEPSETIKILNQAVKRGTMLREFFGYEMYLKNPERNPSQLTLERASNVNSIRRRNYDGETFTLGLISYHLMMTMGYLYLFWQLKNKWM